MKHTLIAALLVSGIAHSSAADGMSDAVMELDVIVAETAASSSSAKAVVLMAALVVLAAAAAH